MKLTQLQNDIINLKYKKVAVQAAAASLKTSTLIEKIRQLLVSGYDPGSIAVITFTRMAAAELIERLGKDYSTGLFVGTIHSLAAHFLVLNGLGNRIKTIAEEEDFDLLFSLCQNIDVSTEFNYVFLDEAQDTGEKELEFIFEKIKPDNFFVVYDLRQSIYSFKGANPKLLIKYLKDNNALFCSLNENFRNGKEILNFAKSIIHKSSEDDDSIAMKQNGEVIKCKWKTDMIINLINSYNDYKDWAILTYSNRDLSILGKYLKQNNIPYNTFKQSEITHEQLNLIMKENKVKLLTIHSSKGLGFKNVIVYNPSWWMKDAIHINYVAATRAKDLLIWASK